jgi:hypothetical protein
VDIGEMTHAPERCVNVLVEHLRSELAKSNAEVERLRKESEERRQGILVTENYLHAEQDRLRRLEHQVKASEEAEARTLRKVIEARHILESL